MHHHTAEPVVRHEQRELLASMERRRLTHRLADRNRRTSFAAGSRRLVGRALGWLGRPLHGSQQSADQEPLPAEMDRRSTVG